MRTKDELEFDACFDEHGMLRDGITNVKVPIKLIDSAAPKPKPDYYVKVSGDIALHDAGEYIRRRPKKVQYRDPEGDEEGTAETVEDQARPHAVAQAGFVARDAVTTAVLDDCYSSYDQDISQRWRDSAAEPLEAITGQGSHGHLGARPGDLCTVRSGKGKYGPEGSAGTIQEVDGELVCVANGADASAAKPDKPRRQEIYDPAKGAVRPHGAGYDAKDSNKLALGKQSMVLLLAPQDVQAANAVKESAYSEYDESLRDAWRAK